MEIQGTKPAAARAAPMQRRWECGAIAIHLMPETASGGCGRRAVIQSMRFTSTATAGSSVMATMSVTMVTARGWL